MKQVFELSSCKSVINTIAVIFSDYSVLFSSFYTVFSINYFNGSEDVGLYSTLIIIPQLLFTALSTPLMLSIRKLLVTSMRRALECIHTFNIFKFSVFFLLLFLLALLSEITGNYSFKLLIILTIIKGFEFIADTFMIWFHATRNFRNYVLFKTIYSILVICSMTLLYYDLSLFNVLAITSFVSFLYCASSMIAYRMVVKKINFIFNFDFLIDMLRKNWPLLLNNILFQFSNRGYLLILSIFFLPEVIGRYVLVISLISVVTAFSNSLGLIFFSRFTQILVQDKKSFLLYIDKSLKYLTLFGVILILVVNLFIHSINGFFFELDLETILLFRIVSISILPISLIGVIGNIFTIIGEERWGLFVSFIIVLISIFLFSLAGYLGSIYYVGFAYFAINCISFALIYDQSKGIVIKKRQIEKMM